MKTLIIPCAGKSSRYPDTRPKWLLTYPDGSLMIQKCIQGFKNYDFDRIVITILEEHCAKYDADIILKQAFPKELLDICILKNRTNGPAETVYQTIKKTNIAGQIIVKDSDNYIEHNELNNAKNFIYGININKNSNIDNINAKSFLIINKDNKIIDIIEKKVVSNIISIGMYGFSNSTKFINQFEKISNTKNSEIFISHIISNLIRYENIVFDYIESKKYEDWGSIDEWRKVQNRQKAIFCDIDGVIFENIGKYGVKNWENECIPIKENIEILNKQFQDGATIILTTSRSEDFRKITEKNLSINNLKYHKLIMGLPHSPRLLINDFSSTNNFPTAYGISIPRNTSLKPYLIKEN